MIVITDIMRDSLGCPAQWIGFDDKFSYIIRYRSGVLRVTQSDNVIYSQKIGPNMDGHINFERVKECLKGLIQFNCVERRPIDNKREHI